MTMDTIMIDNFKSSEFKQVEKFTVGCWNEQQVDFIEDIGYIPVLKGGEITYHPENNEYVVWSVGFNKPVVTTSDKWYAYAIYMDYKTHLNNKV